MPQYPQREANLRCACPDSRAAVACLMGHATECHAPFDCPTAACGHLWIYNLTPAEIADLQRKALATIRASEFYTLDTQGEIARPYDNVGPFSVA